MLVVLMVALALLLAWTVPTMVLSLVAGLEVFLLPVITQVDAEPLPSACAATAFLRTRAWRCWSERPYRFESALEDA